MENKDAIFTQPPRAGRKKDNLILVRKKTKKQNLDDRQLELFGRAYNTVRLIEKVKITDFKIASVTPPGSFIADIISQFDLKTDIPSNIQFFSIIEVISGFLLQKRVCLKLSDGQTFRPNLWTVILADSGIGKTFSIKKIIKLFIKDNSFVFPLESFTSATFMAALQEHNNKLIITDEFGPWIKNVNTQTYMQEMGQIILKMYDGDILERITQKQTISVKDPTMSWLAATVLKTFFQCVDMEFMTDGKGQRFNYIIARLQDKIVPLYKFDKAAIGIINNKWIEFSNIEFLPEYTISDETENFYNKTFLDNWQDLVNSDNKDLLSYFRRISISMLKYALIYHCVLNPYSPEIDLIDMEYAKRVVDIHLLDLKTLLLSNEFLNDFAVKVKKTAKLIEKFKSEGKVCKPRDVRIYISGVKSGAEAIELLNAAKS